MYIYVDSWSLPSNSINCTMPKMIHEFVARDFWQSHQFAIVFITEIDDGSLSRSFFGVLGRQGICWFAVAVNSVPSTAMWIQWWTALFAWIEEADKNPQIICRDDPQVAEVAFFWSYTIGKGPYKGIIENQETRKVGLSETHASGNREASTHNDWWKANWWNKY